MKINKLILPLILIAGLSSCSDENTNQNGEMNSDSNITDSTEMMKDSMLAEEFPTAIVTMEGKSNSNLTGTISLIEIKGKVQMVANLAGLEEGDHAIHIHAMGDCSAHDAKSAGGHWNPTKEKHGKWGEGEFHRGDIGNITADENGVAKMSMETDLWCLTCDDSTRNILGKSMMIHAGTDDLTSQPSGNAGARVGCGVIQMK